MEYKLYKTKAKTAKENNLQDAGKYYYDSKDIFYDFSILENMPELTETEKEAIKADTMKYHSISWYDQPLPLLVKMDNFNNLHGQLITAAHRVYKADGRRMMVIVEVIKAKIERYNRKDVWQRIYDIKDTFTANKERCTSGDYEIA